VAVFIKRPLYRAPRRGDDKAARTESEVDQLHDPRLALEKDILSDDSEIGGSSLDIRRDVAGTGKHELDLAPVHDEPPTAGSDAGDVEADGA
jgi:hypothetical protein